MALVVLEEVVQDFMAELCLAHLREWMLITLLGVKIIGIKTYPDNQTYSSMVATHQTLFPAVGDQR